LIALANNPDKMPRRLVYVVNRRTVVDQTTNEVEKLRNNLQVAGLIDPLKKLCAIPSGNESPLAISTLRGQFADNREWSADPCRPAVICGTVDMIGSRLLFSGYRVGFKGKPLHAGFLGQDALLVHDEAHLEPAYQSLIEEIQAEQHERERVGELPWRKLRVMALTATSRNAASEQNVTFELTEAEKNVPAQLPDPPTEPIHHVWRRLNAKKGVRLHSVTDENKLAEEVAEIAAGYDGTGRAVLIFLREVNGVESARKKLPKGRTQQLTGALRGFERDRLPNDPIFKRFLPNAGHNGETVFLLCTSAGEVGVNISADHLVCDLTTFESMAQRLGRVNRFGAGDANVDVVYSEKFNEKDSLTPARKNTLALLKALPSLSERADEPGVKRHDASPAALGNLDAKARQDAFAPTPIILPATDILFDAWTMTTIREKLPGRPSVEPYLHGRADWQPPETHVAWREEVGVITADLLTEYKPEDLLEDYPLKPHELLRDLSSRVFDRLKKLGASAETPVWIVADDGSVRVTTLGEVIEQGKEQLEYRTVLLPPSAGGLANGMLSSDSDIANDVADAWLDEDGNPRRCRTIWDDDDPPEGMRLIRTIDTKPDTDEAAEQAGRRYWHWYVRPRSADDDASRTGQNPVRWDDHTNQVTGYAKEIAPKLGLPVELQRALVLAARFHDLGKKRELWQRSIGNPNPPDWHAKSGKGWKPRDINENYRHEFGSLLDARSDPEFQQLSSEYKDLVLHLIAAHHGRGRPHFPADEAFDPEAKGKDVMAAAAEVPRWFARLQRKYGRWGLAYLESLLRAADYAASINPSITEGNP
jgi:CRISPR-associated endonuclease/helicase Cas3